jgi:Ca2+-binding RTX toxin-like protein
MVARTFNSGGVNLTDVTASEMVSIAVAQANARISWAGDGCTSFVWGVASRAGVCLGPGSFSTSESLNGVVYQDGIGRVVPYGNTLGNWDDGKLNAFTTTSGGANIQSFINNLQVGDIVRMYDNVQWNGTTATTSENAARAHSFIVVSISSRSADGSGIQIVDNFTGGVISQHSMTSVLNYYKNSLLGTYISRLPSSTSSSGTSSADVMLGSSSSNTIRGYGGNDSIYGRAGNDSIYGGTGTDKMFGGSGSDKFIFALGESVTGTGRDVVGDFTSGSDMIDVSLIDANRLTSGNEAFTYVGRAAFSGVSGQLRMSGGIVYGDTNGDRAADFEIQVQGSNMSIDSLGSTSFVL